MNVERLHRIIDATTGEFRKGPGVVQRGAATEIFAMPPISEIKDDPDVVTVDCHFFVAAVSRSKAQEHRAELIGILRHYPEPDRLAGGPSYIEMGAVIGDQGYALRLYALGEVVGLWKVITPHRLGFDGDEADRMAGSGLVMISGLTPDSEVERG